MTLPRNKLPDLLIVFCPVALCYLALFSLVSAQTDNGLPASKADDFAQKYGPKNGSSWRTYDNTKTGDSVSFNPKTSEVWFNPVTKKYEAVLREDGSPDPKENSVTTSGNNNDYQKTEKWFNPVSKRFEDVLVEAGPAKASSGGIQYPDDLDNGLPSKTANNWQPVNDDTTSSSWKTYKNRKTGQEVSFDPTTSELWYNPVKEKWEAVARESSEQQTYIKSVAREMIYKKKPANARHWRCFAYNTVHDSPDECADPDKGGEWIP